MENCKMVTAGKELAEILIKSGEYNANEVAQKYCDVWQDECNCDNVPCEVCPFCDGESLIEFLGGEI